MIATIHQPDFFPWMGLVNKIANSDIFVILDHTENDPRKPFWCRRVKILVNKEPRWITVTLEKASDGRMFQPINEMIVKDSEQNRLSDLKSYITRSYQRAPFFQDYSYLLDCFFDSSSEKLAVRNIAVIKETMNILEIEAKVVLSSSLGVTSKATQLNIDLTKAVGADTYLCGNGAAGYQDDELFAQQGIKLRYNSFNPISYPQIGVDEFIPGLSILDALFQIPIERVKQVVHSKNSNASG